MTQSFADPGSSGGELQRQVSVDLTANVSGYTSSMQQALADTQALSGALGQVATQADSLSKRMSKSLVHFTIGDFAALSGAVAVAGRFESQLSTLNATAAVTGSSMPALKRQISGVFTDFPVWRQQIVQLAQAISNLGVTKPADIGTLTRSYVKLGAATGEDSSGLAAGGVQLARQMGNMDPSRIDKYNNALLVLSKNAGVSATAVSEFAQNLAPFARQAGIGEAAVLGIATAFQKAGADGNVAANAFSKISGEISSLTQTGSPDIAKYSSFLGKSNQQFKSLSGQEQVTQIFEKVAKGGPQAAQFLADQGGVRAVSAIQKVAQTGDLRGQIAMAENNSQDTKKLDKGSEAAMGGFNDAITKVRNQFTELATAIGDPLLAPLTAMAKAFGDVVGWITKFTKALGPLPAIAGVAAGAVAIPAAFGMAHMGIATAGAMGRAYLGQNSGWRTAMREGRAAGAAVQGGMSETQARAMGTLGGTPLPRHLQGLYDAQFARGQTSGPQGPGLGTRIGQSGLGQAFAQGRAGTPAGPPGAGMAGMASNVAYAAGGLRLGPAAGRMGAWAAESTTQPFDDARARNAARRDWAARARGEDPTDGRSSVGRIGRSFRRAPFLASEEIGRDVASAGRAIGGPIGGAARGAGGAWASISRGAGAVSGLLGPIGLAAAIGIPLISAISSGSREREAKRQDVSSALGGASKYDQALDSSSTNLAKFGGAVNDAADRLSKFANTDVSKLTGVTREDIGAVNKGDYKITDPALADVVKASGGDKNAITAYFKSMGIQAGEVTGDRFTKYKQDLLKTMGVSRSKDVEEIMTGLASGTKAKGGLASTADFTALGRAAQGSTGEEFKNIVGAGVSGIDAASAGTGQKGELARLSNLLHLGATASGASGKGQSDRVSSVINEIASATGIDPKEFQKQVNEAAKQLKTSAFTSTGGNFSGHAGPTQLVPFGNQADASKVLSLAYSNSSVGKANLASMGISGQTLAGGAATGMAFPSQVENDTRLAELRGKGQLGGRIAGLDSVKASMAAPENPFINNKAQQQIVDQARDQAGGDTIKAEADLRRLAGGAGDSLGKLMLAAADAAAGLSSLTAATQTKPQQFGAAGQRYTALKGISDENSSPENVAATEGAKTAGQGAAVGLLDYGRSLIDRGRAADKANQRAVEDNARQIQLTNESYSRQAARSEEDNARARSRSERNFERSSLQASEDYYRNRGRQVLEFGISQQRAEEQFNRSRARTIEDFQIQAERSEEQYNRNRLRTIDDFNTQAERAETSYQLQRARTIEDAGISEQRSIVQFNLQNSRAVEDFNRSKARQLEEFNISEKRATEDFNRSMARQAEDAAKNIYDPFARIQRKGTASAAGVVRNLGQQNKAMTKQLTQLQQARDMGMSAEAIKTLNLADPKNAQQLDSIIKGLGTNPKLAGQLNAEVQARLKASKSLVTSQYSTEYGRQVDDFRRQQDHARDDLRRGMDHGDDDFRRSMKRGAHDFGVSIDNSRKDLNKSLGRSAHDYGVSVRNSQKDLNKSLKHSAEDFATGVANSEADLKTSLKRSSTDFAISVGQNTDDFKRALDTAATEFGISQQRAKLAQETALSDMATDFATTAARASSDHATALDNMATAYKTQQDRAAEDLKDSFRQYTGGFNEMMTEMTSQATGAMAGYAPEAASAYMQAIADVGTNIKYLVNIPGVSILIGSPASFANPEDTGGNASGGQWNNPGGAANNPQNSGGQWDNPGGAANNPQHAAGGIATRSQLGVIGEAGPEAIIPLNSRGEDFMASLIAKSLARGITAAVSSTDSGATSTTNTHTISFAGADIQVVASDPNKMARELEAKAKLKRLTSPN